MRSPRVTVLMPVHNGAAHLASAIRSVLEQTFTDLELLVVDDGSTDPTAEILMSVPDPRLRVLRMSRSGIVAALNTGLDAASGQLLARMDADDLADPERLARQVAFLDRNPGVVACGTDYELFGAATGRVRMPRTPAQCRARLLFGTCIAHPSALLRLAVLRDTRTRYQAEYTYAEDYKLFSELSRLGDLANLPFTGLRYRVDAEQVSATASTAQRTAAIRISRENLAAAGVTGIPERVAAVMIWPPGRGPTAALRYAYRYAPTLIAVGARAGGLAGAATATRLVRERLNTVLRQPAGTRSEHETSHVE
ncbi:glycosyltransferase family A protein [Solwaraspora sp. WMMD406]|uniref:glycosyltransferase family 2 protein n=1 Tax=Solwaraspora sp. WMMD406 TaxID=3016095 RepID=UPI002415D851|nr:glycosyltransferase family A protein [Solwaraspora sp. WMMD406]MDG4762602.1 glycosyltransferase family A protein [Solwaraspora sp. WMMD406]